MKGLLGHWPEGILALIGAAAIFVLIAGPIQFGRMAEPTYLNQPISFWVRQLDSPNPHPAQRAIRAIGLKGLPFLLKAASEGDSGHPGPVTALSLQGLDAVPALTAAFDDPNDNVRFAAIRAIASMLPNLGSRRETVMPGLTKLLRDSNSEIQLSAAFAVANIGPIRTQAIPSLILCLESVQRETGCNGAPIQQVLIDALGRCGPQATAAVPTLIGFLTNKNPSVREQAAIGIWHISRDLSLTMPELSKMLSETNVFSHQLAVTALSRIRRETQTVPLSRTNLILAQDQP